MALSGSQAPNDQRNVQAGEAELYLDSNQQLHLRRGTEEVERPPRGRDGAHPSSSRLRENEEEADSEGLRPGDPAPVTVKQLENLLTDFRKKIANDMDDKVKSLNVPVGTVAGLPKNPKLKSVSTRKKTPKPKDKAESPKVDWEKVLRSRSNTNLPPKRNLILQQPASMYRDAREYLTHKKQLQTSSYSNSTSTMPD